MRVAFSRIDRNTNSRSPGDFEMRRKTSEVAVSRSSASSRSRRRRAYSLASARIVVALRRFGIALRIRALASLLLARERRRIAHPKGLGLRRFSKSITPGICGRRNGVSGSVCTAAILRRSCPLWVKSRHCIRSVPCPLYPQKRTFVGVSTMSALCQKRHSALRQRLALFDDLIGGNLQRL